MSERTNVQSIESTPAEKTETTEVKKGKGLKALVKSGIKAGCIIRSNPCG